MTSSMDGPMGNPEDPNEIERLRLEVARLNARLADREVGAAELRHRQTLDAISVLAGSIAHDFGNVLTSIMGYASVLQLRADKGTPAAKAADMIMKAGEKASVLTGHLLTLSRRGAVRRGPVDVHGIIDNVSRTLERVAGERVSVVRRLGAGRSRINGDPHLLQSMFLHLGTNSCDAMPGGGQLMFETEVVTPDGANLTARPGSSPVDHISVRVSDSGQGIAPDASAHIYEPFFTTKPGTDNLGLGLSMASGVVKHHAGSISCTSTPGTGTTFTVLLPLS
jgi:signal transduction histidine kinase